MAEVAADLGSVSRESTPADVRLASIEAPKRVSRGGLGVDAPGAVDAAGINVDLMDEIGKPGVADRSRRGRASQPAVVARDCPAEHSAVEGRVASRCPARSRVRKALRRLPVSLPPPGTGSRSAMAPSKHGASSLGRVRGL